MPLRLARRRADDRGSPPGVHLHTAGDASRAARHLLVGSPARGKASRPGSICRVCRVLLRSADQEVDLDWLKPGDGDVEAFLDQ